MQCEVEMRNYEEMKATVYSKVESIPASDNEVLREFKRGIIEEFASISKAAVAGEIELLQ